MAASAKMPSDAAVRAWTRLNRAQRAVFGRIEAAVAEAGFPALTVYDALLELWRAPKRRLRQVDLEQALLFPQYSVSRLVDRLEKDHLVRRERCEADARVTWVAITEKGLKLREAMWPIYAEAIARHVGDKLSTAEAAALANMLEKLYKS
jgi:DNA-binding MarR family transcriptional regulator